MQPGDILQLGNSSGFYHSPVTVAVEGGRIFVAAHSYDAYMRPLDSCIYEKIRFLHIKGVRLKIHFRQMCVTLHGNEFLNTL